MCPYGDELKDDLNTQVLIIGFGSVEYARHWLDQTCDEFPLLLDQERQVYHAYDLKESWLRSWNFRTLVRYIRLLLSGAKWRGIRGKSTQLGGDFIVDSDGIIRLAYRSREAADRPEVGDLLETLRELAKESESGS